MTIQSDSQKFREFIASQMASDSDFLTLGARSGGKLIPEIHEESLMGSPGVEETEHAEDAIFKVFQHGEHSFKIYVSPNVGTKELYSIASFVERLIEDTEDD